MIKVAWDNVLMPAKVAVMSLGKQYFKRGETFAYLADQATGEQR